MSTEVKTKMTITLEDLDCEIMGEYDPPDYGDSGCSRGVVGLCRNPSPSSPASIVNLTVFLDGHDITRYVSESDLETAEEQLIEKYQKENEPFDWDYERQ